MAGGHELVDKGHAAEARLFGYGLRPGRAFAEPGVQPSYGISRAFRIDHIDLTLQLDPRTPGLNGVAILEIRPLPAGLGEIRLDLSEELTVSSVTFGGRALAWRHIDDHLIIDGVPEDGGAVRIAYAGGAVSRGLYFTGPTPAAPHRSPMVWSQCQDENAHYLFPCIDYPSARSRFTIRLQVGAGWTTVSNGVLAERSGGLWVWRQDDPIPAYLVTVVVADLMVVEAAGAAVPVRFLARAGTDPGLFTPAFRRTPQMINFFSARFGVDYPWARYDQVVVDDFIFGGMENVAATTLLDLALVDERAALDAEMEDLIAHELGHQWFGDLVTCQDWSQAWLNEGWATYTESLWRGHVDGADEARLWLYRQMSGYFAEEGSRYRRTIVNYRYRSPIDLFDRHLYEKGALVIHTLRTILGEAAFWAGVRLYLERHRLQPVHTRHFQRALEDASGQNLDGFFQQYVFGAGHPELDVTISHTDGALNVAVKQTQSGEAVAEAFAFPLEIRVVQGDVVTVYALPVAERERTWSLPCALLPDRVEVNPQLSVLCALSMKAPVGMLLDQLHHSPDPVSRIFAAEALSKQASRKARAGLRSALGQDAHHAVRARIAALLGKHADPADREALLDAMDDASPQARRAIVDAVASIKDDVVADAFEERLGRNEEPSLFVEGALLRGLGLQRAEGAVALLAEHLNAKSWGDTLRCRALEGMSYTRDPAALPYLLSATEETATQRVRATAAAGLGRLADQIADEAVRRDAVDRLVVLARSGPFRVRYAAIGALGIAADARGLGILRQIHETDLDGRLQRSAYEAAKRAQAGRTSAEGLNNIRDTVDAIREENRKLRDRLDRIEAQE
ncbi:MAG: M1 family aminopeptidase [Myxococcota bacterium]